MSSTRQQIIRFVIIGLLIVNTILISSAIGNEQSGDKKNCQGIY
jgi:hypothetical protein